MTDDKYDVSVGVNQNLRAILRVAPEETPSGVAVVEHILGPNRLAAPLHRHCREDELSLVLEGQMGIQEGETAWTVGEGDIAVKERGLWHTFWNPGTDPLRFLEFIAPGDFAWYFQESAQLFERSADEAERRTELAAIHDKYGFELRPESVPDLLERHGLDG